MPECADKICGKPIDCMSEIEKSEGKQKNFKSKEEMKEKHWEVDCKAFIFTCTYCRYPYKQRLHSCVKILKDERNIKKDELKKARDHHKILEDKVMKEASNPDQHNFEDQAWLESFYESVYKHLVRRDK